MARLTNSDREKILADFHTGHFSLRQLAERYNTSPTTINKLTKGINPKHKDKVDTLVSIKADLANQSLQEVDSVNQVVNFRTKHLVFFQESALSGQMKANDLLVEVTQMKDALAYANLTKANKETVLGKDVEAPTKEDDIETVEIL